MKPSEALGSALLYARLRAYVPAGARMGAAARWQVNVRRKRPMDSK